MQIRQGRRRKKDKDEEKERGEGRGVEGKRREVSDDGQQGLNHTSANTANVHHHTCFVLTLDYQKYSSKVKFTRVSSNMMRACQTIFIIRPLFARVLIGADSRCL